MGYSQLLELGVPGSQGQAAQSSPGPMRTSWLLGPQGGIPSPSTGGKGTVKCHSPAGHGGCGGPRLPALAQNLLFPEHGTAMDRTVETVSRLQQASGQVLPCPTHSPREGVRVPSPAPAAGHAAAAGRPSCWLRSARGVWRPPGGAAGGRPAWPAPDAPSFSSFPAQSPATRPTPPGRGGEEARFSLLKAPPGSVPTTLRPPGRGRDNRDGAPLPLPVVRRTKTTGPGLCPAAPASCSPAMGQKKIMEVLPSGRPL